MTEEEPARTVKKETGVTRGGPKSALAVLWIHGYTGSASAFTAIAEIIAREFDAYVEIPLLPGHGTQESELEGITAENLIEAVRPIAQRLRQQHKTLVIAGYSFGGYIAVELAREVGADGLLLSLTPYRVRTWAKIPGLATLLSIKTFWSKCLTREDMRVREGTFYYPHLPGKSLQMIYKQNQQLASHLRDLACPILVIHNSNDPLVDPCSGAEILAANTKQNASESHVLEGGRHALFFTPDHVREEKIVIDFLKKILP